MVHTTCAVRDCMSSSRLNKNLMFHQFPHSIERCMIWIDACGRPDLIGKSPDSLKNTHICSLHFQRHMYGKKSLKKTAIPALFLPVKDTCSIHTQTDLDVRGAHSIHTQTEPIMKNLNDVIVPKKEYCSIVIEQSNSMEEITQTTNALVADCTPLKRKMNKEVNTHKKIKLFNEKTGDISEDQFLLACDKFLCPQLCAIVNARLHLKGMCSSDHFKFPEAEGN